MENVNFNIFYINEVVCLLLSSNTLCVRLFFLFCRFVVEVVKLYCHVMVTVSSDVVVFVCMYCGFQYLLCS